MNPLAKFRFEPFGLVIGVGVGSALGVSNGWPTGLGVGLALAVVFGLRPKRTG